MVEWNHTELTKLRRSSSRGGKKAFRMLFFNTQDDAGFVSFQNWPDNDDVLGDIM